MKNTEQLNISTHTIRHGVVASYIHPGASLGVLIEVGCESDITARTGDFQNLVRDIAMQVAAANPRFIHKEEVTQAALDSTSEQLRKQARAQGKPESMIERLVANHMARFHAEHCLYEQAFIKEPAARIRDLIDAHIEKLGETIVIKRFVRMEMGVADCALVTAHNASSLATSQGA